MGIHFLIAPKSETREGGNRRITQDQLLGVVCKSNRTLDAGEGNQDVLALAFNPLSWGDKGGSCLILLESLEDFYCWRKPALKARTVTIYGELFVIAGISLFFVCQK